MKYYFLKKFPKILRDKNKLLGLVLAVVVMGLLFWGLRSVDSRFYNIISYFSLPYEYQKGIVLFYGEGCQHCDRVDDFIAKNKVEAVVTFSRLEVLTDSANRSILFDRAQICGIPENQIGVPFLWDGEHKECVVGYLDIIHFFQDKIDKAP